jgi:hypothetical protein
MDIKGKDSSSVRHRLTAALNGEVIRQPVYAVYDWFVRNRPIDWQSLFDLGLGQINHADVVEDVMPNVEIVETHSQVDGQLRRDVRWITDLGELHEWYLGEWRQEHLIKSPQDYRIMRRALSDVMVKPNAEPFLESEKTLGDAGLTLGQLSRTPLQRIQIDFVGLEQFSIDLAGELPELMELIELMNDLKLREFQAATQTPAKYIKLWENLTIETMGPRLYRQFLVPLYRKIGQIVDLSGQKVIVHYDGKLKLIAEDIQRLPFDGLDSLTPAPEGDVPIAEARKLWPEKFFWLHPPLGWFRLPEKELIENIERMIQDAGSKGYCLLISEEVPPNWQTQVPAVLNWISNR